MTWLSTAPWFVQSPWLLFALLSMIVPLAIHLFSQSKGKLIPFGNIKLIQLSKPVKMNEIRLVERLLLLCRLLVLFFSVLILAQLYYDDRGDSKTNHEGHILVTKDWLSNANESELNQLSLKAKTDAVYLLSKQNERLASEIILAWQNNQNQSLINQKLIRKHLVKQEQNTWLLVNNYSKTLPDNAKIIVYSTNRLSQFIGDKAPLPNNITWQIKKLSANKITASINELRNKTLSVLVISDDDSKEELGYLNAALSIIKETKLKNLTYKFQTDNFPKNNASLGHESNDYKIYDDFDWILYLSSAAVPTSVLEEMKKGTKLIANAKHSDVKNATSLVQWHEQATQLQFPQMLLSILLDESIANHQMQQQLTNKQIESQPDSNTKVRSEPLLLAEPFKNPFIDKLLIFLLILFWSIERMLSEFKKVIKKVEIKKTRTKSAVTNSSSDSSTSQKIERY